MGWPKGKPRGPASKNLREAIAQGQRERFENPKARQGMSNAILQSWQTGARAKDRIGGRHRRVNVELSQEDWNYVQWLYTEGGESVSDVIRGAVKRERLVIEADIIADGCIPAWKKMGRDDE